MVKYKIYLKREECIGAAACVAVNRKVWQLMDDGKVDIIGGTKLDNGDQEMIVETDEEEFKKNIESAEVCPVNVIIITNLETGEQVYPKV